MVEHRELGGGEFGDVGGGGGPAGVGVALPSADATARGVEEDAVEFGFSGEAGGAVPKGGAVIEKFRAGGAALKGLDTFLVAVGGPDEALVHHEVGEVERFAAFASAGIPPGLAGKGRGGDADELRGEVLDFESAGFKRFGFEEIVGAGEAEGVGGERGEFSAEEGLGEAVDLARAGAEPEGGIALKLAEVVDGEIGELGFEPLGDGEGGKGFGFDRFRVGGETLVEELGLFEAFLGRGLFIEPLKPAKVDEDGVADDATGRGLDVAVAFEVEAQRGVGTLVGGDGFEHAGGVVKQGLVDHGEVG